MKTVIELAKEAGFGKYAYEAKEMFERFTELVRADEAAKYKWDIHSCGPDCQRYACASMREAVAKERETCAVIAETAADCLQNSTFDGVANAIRARGNT